jgi:hypothetical protein
MIFVVVRLFDHQQTKINFDFRAAAHCPAAAAAGCLFVYLSADVGGGVRRLNFGARFNLGLGSIYVLCICVFCVLCACHSNVCIILRE